MLGMLGSLFFSACNRSRQTAQKVRVNHQNRKFWLNGFIRLRLSRRNVFGPPAYKLKKTIHLTLFGSFPYCSVDSDAR